jgi:hypothetical protein
MKKENSLLFKLFFARKKEFKPPKHPKAQIRWIGARVRAYCLEGKKSQKNLELINSIQKELDILLEVHIERVGERRCLELILVVNTAYEKYVERHLKNVYLEKVLEIKRKYSWEGGIPEKYKSWIK